MKQIPKMNEKNKMGVIEKNDQENNLFRWRS